MYLEDLLLPRCSSGSGKKVEVGGEAEEAGGRRRSAGGEERRRVGVTFRNPSFLFAFTHSLDFLSCTLCFTYFFFFSQLPSHHVIN